MNVVRRLAMAAALGVALAACRSARPDPVPDHPRVDAVALESRMDAMAARMDTLRHRLEALQIQNDSLRRTAGQLESEIHDRDEQIRAIRLELQRLKDIDLKPKRPEG